MVRRCRLAWPAWSGDAGWSGWPGAAMKPQGGTSPGVRATGGAYRGRLLRVPAGARPTEGRVREALFSIWREPLAAGDCRFLDLFAGSGVVGVEAAGRGALDVLCIDDDPQAIRLIAANAAAVAASADQAAGKVAPGGRILTCRRLSLPAGLARLAADGAGPFDLVFADPPYRFDAYELLLAGLAPLLAADAEVVVEHSSRRDLPLAPASLIRTDVRRYGESSLSFYRLAPT
jgi:16S rRNA (guanine966-N2)-methyltransferase